MIDVWNTDRVNRFRAEATSRGLPADDVEEWIRRTVPGVYWTQGGDGPLSARLGGDPLLPADAPDPSFPFVASVDCALLPPGAAGLPLPSDGRLLFFAEPDLGFEGRVPDAVRHIPAGTPTAARRTDTGYEPFAPQDMRTMWHHLSPPDTESFAEARWEDPDDEQYALADELESAWTHVGGSWPVWTFALGGHPVVVHDDPLSLVRDAEPEAEDADDWVLLATWRCGQEVRELDLGVVSWLIRRRDLASLRLDRVHTHVAM
ncbi:DUF1963 domain-containing protein [Streptomyces sp. SID9944]|nr:DUF1963 domain-containing protein [Streptomyces sp. SID9944]